MSAVPADRFPDSDEQIADFADWLGLPGIIDIHVHVLPERLQAAVWRYFDALDDPPWPIAYRAEEVERLAALRRMGVVRHTALAYAHREGMAERLNSYTLAVADAHEQVIPTFTFHPEPGVDRYVGDALEAGGAVAKVHLQVGRFRATDPRLDGVWQELAHRRIPVVIHAGAVYGVDGGQEYCGADVIRALLERHSDVTLVVAHLGAPDFLDFLGLAEEAPTLRMDTAMAFGGEAQIGAFPDEGLDRLAALTDRLVFGSDFPSIPRPVSAQIRGLARIGLDRDGLRAVLHDNAAELLAPHLG